MLLLVYWLVSMTAGTSLGDGGPYWFYVKDGEHWKRRFMASQEAVFRWQAVMNMLFCALNLMVYLCVWSWSLGRMGKQCGDERTRKEELASSSATLDIESAVKSEQTFRQTDMRLPPQSEPTADLSRALAWERDMQAIQRGWLAPPRPALGSYVSDASTEIGRLRQQGHASGWSAETAVC